MYILITYDVNTESPAGRSRLRKISKCCCNYGQRVQDSVFECQLSEAQLLVLKKQMESIIEASLDSIRIYNLGAKYESKIEVLGQNRSYDVAGVLMI